MKRFYGEDLFLTTNTARKLYAAVRTLPIIDYHCHLDPAKIKADTGFSGIGELWLSGDHYKWRAMRLCGVPEAYITGDADDREKFMRYAEIMPRLAGNPLYAWTHLELRQIFGITEPLCAETAERIYDEANEQLRHITVQGLLSRFHVEFVATTDDPTDDLPHHGKHGSVLVCPTFRPDKLFSFDEAYLDKLSAAARMPIGTLDDLQNALRARLDYFATCGCRTSDHGFEHFPKTYISAATAGALFIRRDSLSTEEKDALRGYLLVWLAREYRTRGMLMQLHFGVRRNTNPAMFKVCGADAGFDLPGDCEPMGDLISFFSQLSDEERPQTVLYPLSDANLAAVTALTGAFRGVRIGAPWWFHDTALGIRRYLQTVAEYGALGTHLGMLTDSRSFSSYVRFDFFRRILCDYLGELTERGEYDHAAALRCAEDICYNNIKGALHL